jgi:hypothetical protein
VNQETPEPLQAISRTNGCHHGRPSGGGLICARFGVASAMSVRRLISAVELVTAALVSVASIALSATATVDSAGPASAVIASQPGAGLGGNPDGEPWQHQIRGNAAGSRGPCSSEA